MTKYKRQGPHPISQYVDVHQTEKLTALQSLSGYRLVRPEDGSVPEFLPADSDARELGRALLDAFGRCRYVPPEDEEFYNMNKYYENYAHSEKEILRRTGKRTKSEAYKNAVWCEVRREERQIHMQPFRPATRGNWDMLPAEMCVVIPETTDEEPLGAALKLALERGRTFEG